MELNRFIPGRAAEFANVREYELDRIMVRSGRLLIRDPFESHEDGCVMLVPPGNYRAWVTVVDVNSDRQDHPAAYVPAYLSIQLSMAPPVRLDYADDLVEPPVPSIGAWTGTDHGLIAMHDAGALSDNDIPALADGWDHAVNGDEPYPAGCGNLPLPGTDRCNIVLSRSGEADGAFPVLATFDASGQPTAIHIDFGVVDLAVPSPDHECPHRNGLMKRTPATHRTAAVVRLAIALVFLGMVVHRVATGGTYLLELLAAVVFGSAGVYTLIKYR